MAEDMTQSLGGIKSKIDYRDIQFVAAAPSAPEILPDFFKIDISALPVDWQHKIGACVGHATEKNKQEYVYDGVKVVVPFSSRFVYAVAKCIDGLPGEGTFYRLGVKILQQYGICTEATMPNDTLLDHETYVFNRKLENIPQIAFDEAAKNKINSYARVGLFEDEIKHAIMTCKGVLLGVQVGKEWFTDLGGNTTWLAKDILPLRSPTNGIIGGHAIYVYGWDTVNGRTRFFFRNSWSKDWGLMGDGNFLWDEYLSYTECWSIIDLPDTWLQYVKNLPPAEQFKHNFTADIKFGDRSDEVKHLQTALMIDGEFNKFLFNSLLKTGELGYFGQVTQKALREFQFKYQVASPEELIAVNGTRCGGKTRRQLNLLFNK